jgi:hypothetical protein
MSAWLGLGIRVWETIRESLGVGQFCKALYDLIFKVITIRRLGGLCERFFRSLFEF